jgi:hypothetical protein
VILPLIGPTNEKTPIPLASKIEQDYSIGLWTAGRACREKYILFAFHIVLYNILPFFHCRLF